MTTAAKIKEIVTKSSWIRKMFEEGAMLKEKHGADKVYDFSIGNPYPEPPDSFFKTLKETVHTPQKGDHGYMPNVGYPQVRQAVARYLSMEQGTTLTENEVVMTCGASGALNIVLKAILDPGDEVVTPAPFFVEYGYYADNHGGILKPVQTRSDFSLDLEAISRAITDKTKAVLINSPNNPTGQVYSQEDLTALGDLLKTEGQKHSKTIYLLADEPYRKIVYDGVTVPAVFACYNESIIATSYSKDLSIPGERIGFAAVNPQASFKNDLLEGMALANRILGFVNAPALMQRVVGSIQGERADMSVYTKKRDLLINGLAECGYEFVKPSGAFYLFPKTPIKDDVAFVSKLQQDLILTVPGSGFGRPGYFRIAFCVDDRTIKNALPGFKKAIRAV